MDLFALTLLLGAPSLVGLVGVQVVRILKRRQVRVWREGAVAAGVKDIVEHPSILSSELIRGTLATRPLRFEDVPRPVEEGSSRGRSIRITLEGSSGITLRPEILVTPLEKATGAREIELGDEGFDRDVYIHGPEDVLRAVLDGHTRQVVRRLFQSGFKNFGGTIVDATVTIRDGDIVAEFDQNEGVRAHLSVVLETLLDIACRLDRPTSIVKRIVDNTRTEPEWQVRRGNLLLLANDHPRHPATREALLRGCEDERQAVQLECALALGVGPAEATLTEIATSEWADDADAARAVAALIARLPRERALTILNHALRSRRLQTARASLEVLGEIGGDEVVAPLARVLRVEHGDLALAAARALGASKGAGAEVPLLHALSSPDMDTAIAAAAALGQAGTASAVMPLKEAAERSSGALRKAAREAIAEIQSRLGGASPGQLSLADGEAGQLSLADEDPRGRVSITADGGRSTREGHR
jgi:HEAT repeat protein